MRRVLSCALAVVLVTGSVARADWGAFYRGSPTDAPRGQAAALADRTGMHPRGQSRGQSWARPRLQPIEQNDTQVMPAPPQAATGETRAICVAEILRAQERYGIPDNILLGIGLQEAGVSRGGGLTVWPWAVNAAGEGRIFDNRGAAMDWVLARQAAGVRSIDVGCMQINLHWHPDAFASLEQGFDPVVNVDYAARFLRGLFDETGNWMRAAGMYHSRTPDRADLYLAALRRNVAVANDRIGTFRAMIGAVGPDAMQDVVVQAAAPFDAAPVAAPVAPWDYGHWSTGAGDAGGVYGIYSRAQLEPVLPNFIQDF